MRPSEITNILYNHHRFEECVLEDVLWRNNGTEIDLLFDYIWPDTNALYFDNGVRKIRDTEVRNDLDTPLIKTIRFKMVQEFSIHNWLNDAIIDQPNEIGWGFNEIALIEVKDDNLFLAKYPKQSVDFHHICVFWEGDRRIDIVCNHIEVL